MSTFTKRRSIVAVLIIAMTCGMMSGCGKKTDTAINTDGEIPQTLSIFSALGASLAGAGAEDFNDCMTFQLLEEKTGCHVEWQHPASGAAAERFNFMIASGDYPDCIVYNWNSAKGGVQSYVEDGVIIDLTDYVEECMPNFTKFINDHPEVKRDVVNDEGKIYYIPYIRADKELCVFQGPIIREDWLKKLNLEVPKTADELYTVLKAFKEKDPNGNGKADEIPMGGVGFNNTIGIGSLLWAFGTTWDFQLDGDGEVVYGPLTNEFKQGLEYIAKLYKEGLIDMDYLLDDRAKYDAKFTNDQIGFGFGYQPSKYYPAMNDGTRKVSGIGYFVTEDGKKYCFNTQYPQQISATAGLAVTSANENIAGTLKWLDNLYGEDGFMYANYGKEGLSYELVDGEPVFTDYIKNNENGKTMDQMVALTCGVRDSAFPMLQSWQYYKQTLQPWGIEAVETWIEDDPDLSRILPRSLKLTGEESSTYAEIMNQVETYVLEEANKVVTGKTSVGDWDTVVQKVKDMGIDKVIDIQSDAYARYLKR